MRIEPPLISTRSTVLPSSASYASHHRSVATEWKKDSTKAV